MRAHRTARTAAVVTLTGALIGGLGGCVGGPASVAASSSARGAASTGAAASTTAPSGGVGQSAVSASTPCVGAAAPSLYSHVIWFWFENNPPIVGSSSAPYFTSLANHCGLATNYHAVTHPSLPNYLAATGGSTFGVTDDNPPSSHPISGSSLFGQVRSAGKTWRSYEESMPSNCDLSSSGEYAVKHNPAAYFTAIRSDCSRWDEPMGSTSSGHFLYDINHGTLPTFAFVTPNLCNDMHDCSVSTGDKWLSAWLPKLLNSATYAAGHTAIVVTFDESDDAHHNLVSTILVAPSVKAGTRNGTYFTHYSLLLTTEQMLHLSALRNAANAASMRSAFHL